MCVFVMKSMCVFFNCIFELLKLRQCYRLFRGIKLLFLTRRGILL